MLKSTTRCMHAGHPYCFVYLRLGREGKLTVRCRSRARAKIGVLQRLEHTTMNYRDKTTLARDSCDNSKCQPFRLAYLAGGHALVGVTRQEVLHQLNGIVAGSWHHALRRQGHSKVTARSQQARQARQACTDPQWYRRCLLELPGIGKLAVALCT